MDARGRAVRAGIVALLGGSALVWAGSCGARGERVEPKGSVATSARVDTGSHATVERIAPPTMHDMAPQDFAGLHNVVAYHDGLLSGSMPEGEKGLRSLAAMGVTTIISVDGAEPDVAGAAALGMRYIHLPIGYNGFDETRRLQLSRATRDALQSGPVYMHCHHGKHRSAGAAATVAASLGWQTADVGVERMRVSGTSPAYKGLFARAKSATVIPAATLEATASDFPSVWKPSDFIKGMVEVDLVLEHLLDVRKAGWRPPEDHPDLVPVAEAGRLADLYRMMAEGEYTKRQPAGFAEAMVDAQRRAEALEDALRSEAPEPARLGELLTLVAASCKDCHAKFRDEVGM